jgi:hypothetical protein
MWYVPVNTSTRVNKRHRHVPLRKLCHCCGTLIYSALLLLCGWSPVSQELSARSACQWTCNISIQYSPGVWTTLHRLQTRMTELRCMEFENYSTYYIVYTTGYIDRGAKMMRRPGVHTPLFHARHVPLASAPARTSRLTSLAHLKKSHLY